MRIGLIILLLFSGQVMAYWAPKSDSQLICESEYIVYGDFSSAPRNINLIHEGVYLSFINIQAVLLSPDHAQGNESSQWLAFQVPSPNAPISSDMLFFKEGKKGLWFLKDAVNTSDYFIVNHPAQFKVMELESPEYNKWMKRLTANSCRKPS